MHSPDLTQRNIDKVAELFPTVVTERLDDDGNPGRAIDFDLLRQELSDHVVEGPQERYQIDWPGKRAAMFAANAPIAKTLRPVRVESVDFDTTKNLFIEGDNLEALKLLQESYLGKVKLIYIDPPYNTGKDFIYEDDFAETATEYLKRSGQIAGGGSRLVSNPESNGRFHSDWLTMIYSRVKLARNLLADDGVIMVSIDDGELANLKRVLDEVFGEHNFIDTIAVEMSTTSGPKTVNAQQGTIVKNVEFVHVYRRSAEFDMRPHTPLLDGIDAYDTHYSVWLHEDGVIGSVSDQLIADVNIAADIRRFNFADRGRFSIRDMDRLLAVSVAAKSFVVDNLEKIARVDRPPVSAQGVAPAVGRWESFEADHRTYLLTMLPNGTLQALMPLALNYRMSDDYKPRYGRTVIRGDLWKGFHQDMGNVAKEGDTDFSNGKKPVRLVKQLIRWANNTRDGVVMDFFAGSGTTAHAVMEANADDGGNRRFIVIQLNEVPDSNSDVAKAGYSSIAQITRDRIRRVGESMTQGTLSGGAPLDVGFRAFQIDTSNMMDVRTAPDLTGQGELGGLEDSIKSGRSPEDLLFQVLLDWGLELSVPVKLDAIDGREVFEIDGGALIACFDANVNLNVVREIARREPLRVVFRDSAFVTDADRINAEQVFAEVSPSTVVKVI